KRALAPPCCRRFSNLFFLLLIITCSFLDTAKIRLSSGRAPRLFGSFAQCPSQLFPWYYIRTYKINQEENKIFHPFVKPYSLRLPSSVNL
ncbi:MAG: hypothetical protein ACSW8F_05170, partial [bacterium]